MITLLIFSIISALILIYSFLKFWALCKILPQNKEEIIEADKKAGRYMRICLCCLSVILIYVDKLVFDAVGFGKTTDSSIWCGLLYIFSVLVWIITGTPRDGGDY